MWIHIPLSISVTIKRRQNEVYTHCMLLEWNWSDVIVELLACFATCNNVHPSELFMGKVTQSIFCHTFVFALNYIPLQWWCFNETHEQFHIASVFILSIYLFGESFWHKCKWIYFGSTVFGFHRWIFAISICPSFDGCIIKTFFYLHLNHSHDLPRTNFTLTANFQWLRSSSHFAYTYIALRAICFETERKDLIFRCLAMQSINYILIPSLLFKLWMFLYVKHQT